MSSFLCQNSSQLFFIGMHQYLLGMHQCSHILPQAILTIAVKILGILHYSLSPLSMYSSWYWETFIQFSCQIVQFLRSKNRQKGDQFFYQMPDFCENCNPHFLYHTTAAVECLVDNRFAETCKLTLFTPLIDFFFFYQFEKWEFIACSNRQFEHAILYVNMNGGYNGK